MVGQKNLLKQIDWMCQAKCFPRFSILVGENGKQEEEFTRYITKQLGCFLHILPDTKIDTIRDIITESYTIYKPMLYVLQDAYNMSIQAKNSLNGQLNIAINLSDELCMKIFINKLLQYMKLEKYKLGLEYGYDILNPHSSFYNDICTIFDSEYSTDLIIEDRKKYYFLL